MPTYYKFFNRAKVLCIAVMLLGCAGRVTNINSLSFQDGQAQSNEQILLRNIIAAANDRTPTFVAASNVQSLGEAGASLGAQFSIPNTGHTISPGLTGRRSQNATLLDYGATKAAQHLYRAVDHALARQLLIQGWPSELIETVLWGAILIHPELHDLIARKARRICDTTTDRGEIAVCRWTEEMIGRCGDPIGAHGFINHAQSICSFNRFQIIINRLAVTGTEFRIRDVMLRDENGKPVLNDDHRPVFEKRFQEVFDDPEIEHRFEALNSRRAEKDPLVFAVFLRSPAQIIEFLGRLAALQLYRNQPDVAAIPIPGRDNIDWIIPFRIVSGSDRDGPSAVSVRFGGRSYHVPQPHNQPHMRDQSVRVMSLVIELQNLARQEAPIQGSSIAILQ
ncbi:hypothetical protein [Methyloceanibacter superfactus]|uniref:hypothetical protein n=1 Tax=Methyloceanibacter superfactus TaxID=1774969 RepID=UPI00114CD2ED|nr:hypothetical protein [Methyloceanibacter superfactus]